jgi:hypothetical protein
MLVSMNVEELFVHSIFFPDPANRAILKYYNSKLIDLLQSCKDHISDHSTRSLLIKTIRSSRQVQNNLKAFYPALEIRESALEDGLTFLPNELSNCTIARFAKSEIPTIHSLKNRVLANIKEQVAGVDPIDMANNVFLNMSQHLDVGSFRALRFFRCLWEKKSLGDILSDEFKEKFGSSLYEMEGDVLRESYRQVLITEVDMQRRLRREIAKYLSSSQGTKKVSFKELINFANLALTADSLDRISYHLEIGIPIYIVQSKTLSLFFPEISELETYPFHMELDKQYGRMLAHYAASVEPDMIVPYEDLVNKKFGEEFSRLTKIFQLFSFPEEAIVKPISYLKEIGNDESILKTSHNPFISIETVNGKWLFTSSILVHDAIFRFIWKIRTIENPKKIGTSFEDEIATYLAKKFHASNTRQHLILHKPSFKGEQDRLEIDVVTILDEKTMICVECKDYALLEDPDDFKKLAQRSGVLMQDCSYFGSKVRVLLRSFEHLSEKFSEFKKVECVVPVMVVRYPDIVINSQEIPLFTQYELVRFLNFIKRDSEALQTGAAKFFDYASKVTFDFRIWGVRKSKDIFGA